jgi:hypothetical protein
VAGADEEVSLPVAGYGAVVSRGGSLPNRHGVHDVAPRMGRRALRSTIGAALAEVRHQRLLQHAATLHKKAEIDRLVRHVHLRIVRIRVSEPAGDLLGRPLEREFGRHGLA